MSCATPKPVDIDKYMGSWYSYQQSETWYQSKDELECVTASYAPKSATSFSVNNGSKINPQGSFEMEATLQDDEKTFFVAPPGNSSVGGTYAVLKTDYTCFSIVVGSPLKETADGKCSPVISTEFMNDAGMFFLTRDRIPTDVCINKLEDAVLKLNLETSSIHVVNHNDC